MQGIARAVHAAAICATLLFAGHASAQQQASLSGLYVNATQDSDVISKAIEAVVTKMNFIKRPIARSRLTKTNPLYRRIEISQTATDVSVRFDQGKPVSMPLDSTIVNWERDDGEVFEVRARLQDSQLTQGFKADDGLRLNHFILSPDGNTLTLQVTLTSPQLPALVKYTLIYRRSS